MRAGGIRLDSVILLTDNPLFPLRQSNRQSSVVSKPRKYFSAKAESDVAGGEHFVFVLVCLLLKLYGIVFALSQLSPKKDKYFRFPIIFFFLC